MSKPEFQKRRVVVTGIGAVTPLGHSVEETWQGLLAGKSGVGRITHFDTADCPVKIAAEVRDYEVSAKIDSPQFNAKEVKRMGRFIQLSLGATWQAYVDSKLEVSRGQIDWERAGVNIGVGMGGLPEIEHVHQELLTKGFRRVTPFLIPQIIPNMASGQASILLGLKGPNLCSVSACASSAHSIGESFRLIQRGEVDVMLAGGAEAVISPLGIGGFAAMRALSTRNDEPTRASRPFDSGRDGFVMGEGAVTLVLESFEHAQTRGARIYGEIVGYGLTADAFHMTTPAPEGEGGYRAMKMAVTDAAIAPSVVGYVNAHGTSTPAGDSEEARAIARVFGDARKNLHVSSTKSMTGHLLGAAGALETLACILATRDGIVPPTINLEALDPTCAATEMNFTANHAVKKPIEYALSNSFGFGGTNASILVRRWSEQSS